MGDDLGTVAIILAVTIPILAIGALGLAFMFMAPAKPSLAAPLEEPTVFEEIETWTKYPYRKGPTLLITRG